MIHWDITIKSTGERLQFTERNLFDFGKVVNPAYAIKEGMAPGGVLGQDENGDTSWQTYTKSGWEFVRKATDAELIATKYIGLAGYYANAWIRM